MFEILKFDHQKKPATRQLLHEMACRHVEESFPRQGTMDFIWLLANFKNVVWLRTNWANDDEKLRVFAVVHDAIKQLQVTAYAVAVEAWMASDTRNDGGKPVAPRDRPASERDDIAMISSFDHTGGAGFTRYLITVREPIGPNFLGPRVEIDVSNGSWSGNMWNLFDD